MKSYCFGPFVFVGELHQYWLDRYSLDEIHELAAGLLPLDVSDPA